MTNSIHSALWEWFAGCSVITKLFFNFSGTEDGDTAITPAGEMVLDDYIDGSQRRRYAFELIRYLPATFKSNDPGNVEMMEDVERISKWVEQQNAAGNFPAFPSGCQVENVYVLEESAGYAAATDQNTAKYMIPFAIDYMKG